MIVPDQLLAAYLDGEVDEDERRRIAAAVAEDTDLRARADRIQALRARLTTHYARVLDEPLPERFTRLLGSSPAPSGEIVDLAAARAKRVAPRRPMPWRLPVAIAASTLLGVAIGQFDPWRPSADVISEGGALTVHSALARSLDRQLASTQLPTATIRIGLTFYDTANQLCRTFASPSIAGLACRTGDRWTLKAMSMHGQDQTASDYRQAASQDPLILQAAQSIMRGDALDAPAERSAIQAIGRHDTYSPDRWINRGK